MNEYVNEVLVKGILGKPRKNNRGEQYIPVYLNGATKSDEYNIRFVTRGDVDVTLRPGDYVDVKGRTIGYNYYDREEKRAEHTQFFVADSIKRAETDLHKRFGVYGGYRTNTSSKVYLAGTISSVSVRDQWGRINVMVENSNGERPYIIAVNMYVSGYRTPSFDFVKGDKVCIVATIRQRTKKLEGKMVRFENINVEDIVATEKVPRPEKKKQVITTINHDDVPDFDEAKKDMLSFETIPAADEQTSVESGIAAETDVPDGFDDMTSSIDDEEEEAPLTR